MSFAPSTCNNIDANTLSNLYSKLKSVNSIAGTNGALNNFNGLNNVNNINAFNYLVGFEYTSSEPSFFVQDTTFTAQTINSKFNVQFMFKAWSIRTNVIALSELILSFQGVDSGNNIIFSDLPSSDIYEFWNYYLDFVFYQFFCNQTGLTSQATKTSIDSGFIDLKNSDYLLLQVKNLHSLLLTAENGGNGLGSGGSGTKRLCEFCADFWGTDARKSILANQGLNNFCGCCSGIPPLNFSTNISQPPIRCQPICSGPNIVKSYAGDATYVNNGGDTNYQNTSSTFFSDSNAGFYPAYYCPNQTICIMDKINVQIAGFNNQLNFNQVCPGCIDGECECFIDTGSNVIDNMSANETGMNNPAVFNQKCGAGTRCYTVNGDGTRVEVKCNSNNVANTSKHPDIGYDGSGKVSFLNSIVATNAYTYGINNIIIPLVIFAVIVFYLLLTTIDIVTHIRRNFKMKNLVY